MTRSNVNLESTESALVALKAFFNIMAQWRVSEKEQRILLGKPDDLTFKRWKIGNVNVLENDVLVRISYVLGIYKNLATLFSEQRQANEWPHKLNRAFDGDSALNYMLLGQTVHLREVRHYLDAQL
ncbi:antitoxin Xre/MbcA/ParS toxin-binding domain-containing protein [Pseudoalteromonas sp. SR41-4]|uniref:antitoxin Xre/MbcA/ParS toxin-binding domain-containing protein n=1 Tax=Pseudoalteromonas sp. SR41-4 TaxID=2760950 RepID=UPI001600F245|nr:antitoxin Xre/MbcA/ParS toxin-binding domain-containing protein [Pseudoalteromonas sp. SR41-4]MBB1291609.1 DUF2384 domain-containing protein [Pseudoalteromonas sp. SR41-4]